MRAKHWIVSILLIIIAIACPDTQTGFLQVKPIIIYHNFKPVRLHDTICIAAVGDIMMGSSFPGNGNLPPDSGKRSFECAASELKSADIAFGNLEGPLLDSGRPDSRKTKMINPYLFRMPTCYARVLKHAGFNLVSIANNHISDFDEEGRLSTMKTLDSMAIHYAGITAAPTAIFKRNGITYGFCSFAPNANTLPILDLKNASRVIAALKSQADIVIVSFHGGAEGRGNEHVPFKMESYLGEKRGDVAAFARNAIDAGADAVFGNGPHIPRACEMYKSRLIAYSLGNFCTYKCVSVNGECGIAPLLKVYLNKKGEFIKGRILSFKQTHQFGLERDTVNLAARRIRELTEADFPDTELSISDDGTISLN